LRAYQFHRTLTDAGQHIARRHPVRAGHGIAEGHMMAQDRHLHLEEFIEIGIGDAQETQPLEQRHGWVLRLREHTEIELELRQLAIEIELRDLEVGRAGHLYNNGHV
jgi:hypothetical protein